jgi:signal transduction histidine kinase/ligand-binding sensor domain-containing protein
MRPLLLSFRLLFLLFILTPSVRGQMPHLYDSWRWVRFGTESGLPSNRIFNVFESGDSVVWAHTSRGLAWYDGLEWHTQPMAGFAETNAQGVHIASDTAGLLLSIQGRLYSVRRDSIEHLPIIEADTLVGTIGGWRDTDGSILVLGAARIYRMKHGVSEPINDFPTPLPILFASQAPYFIPTKDGVWLKAGAGVYRYDNGHWLKAFESPGGFLRVNHIVENHRGVGLAVLEPVSGEIRVYDRAPDGGLAILKGEFGDLIQSITVSETGTILILYSSGHLRLRENGVWTWLPPLPSPVRQARVVRFASNGDLWVGGNDGLYLCRLGLNRWDVWAEPGQSLSNWINEIHRSRDGSFWIGTRDGLQRRTPDGRVTWTREIGGVKLGRVTAIGEDANGNVWIGSGANFSGAFRWDGRSWKHFGVNEGLPAPRVHRIAVDKKGRLWFLCLNSSGVLLRDLSDEPGAYLLSEGKFVHWGRQEGLLDGRVYSFVEDEHGGYWFGGFTGLSRYRNGRWSYWTREAGLNDSRVFTLGIDPSGKVYFSHQFSELGYIDQHDSVRYVTREAGLLGVEIWEVKADERGWIWVGTKSGLVCWNGHDWYTFDTRSGLPNDRIWPVLPLASDVYLGTEGSGVAILHLKDLNTAPPRVVIGEPLVENSRVSLQWRAFAPWGDTPNDLIETRYRLSSTVWSPWSVDHRVAFRGLQPGTYLFEVQAKGSLGERVFPVPSIRVEVPPPLYLRPIFYIPAVITMWLVLGLGAMVWLRNRAFNRVTRENEAKFRAQYKGNPIPIFTFRKVQEGFRLTDYNDAALTISLGHAKEWVGLLYERVFPNVLEGKSFMERCYQSRTTIRTEFKYVYRTIPQVADLTVSFAFVPPDLVLVHTEDVTERKRNELQLRESGEQLRALAVRLQSIREEERTSLSREIHDELGQLMTGLKMDLAWIRRRVLELGFGLPDAVTQRMTQMNGLLEEAIHTVRKIAGQLRPAILDDLGLIPAMEWQAREFSERTNIPCELLIGMEELSLSRASATELFRIYQEMLTNVARHARASRVEIHMELSSGVLVLEVQDNGCGIHMQDVERRTSLGILGMEERAKRIGAALSIQPRPEGGTLARIQVPVDMGGPE